MLFFQSSHSFLHKFVADPPSSVSFIDKNPGTISPPSHHVCYAHTDRFFSSVFGNEKYIISGMLNPINNRFFGVPFCIIIAPEFRVIFPPAPEAVYVV